MSSFVYGFVNARVGAMKSDLLSDAEIKSLIESRNLDDALALLKNTGYGKELSKSSSPSLVEIENVFLRSILKDFKKLTMSVTGIPKAFLAHCAEKLEIESLKLLLIMKSKGEEVKNYPWIQQRITTVPMTEKLSEMKTPEEMVEMLRFTKYYQILHEAASECSEKGTVYPFIKALDTYQYSRMNKIVQRKMNTTDRNIVNHLIGIEIDAKNLLIALRVRGTDENDMMDWLIPVRYHLTDSELMAAYNAKTLTELQQILRHYTDIISASVKECEKTQSLFPLEQEFRRYIIKENNRVFVGDRFHMGVPLAYLNLKENEVRNLTTILYGKAEDLPAPSIEESVILPT